MHNTERPDLADKLVSSLKPREAKGLGKRYLTALQEIENKLIESGFAGGLPLYLSQMKETMNELSRTLGVSAFALKCLFDYYSIPRLSKSEAAKRVARPRTEEEKRIASEKVRQLWQDPEYRENQTRRHKQLWEDPKYREAHIEEARQRFDEIKKRPEVIKKKKESFDAYWADPENRKARRELMDRTVLSPKSKAKQRETMLRLYQDPEYKRKQAEAMKNLWKDPDFRERFVSGVKQKWEDPEFRRKKVQEASETMTRLNTADQLEKAADGIRRLRAKPESASRFFLPTIQGFRKDIGYFAQSAWEANFARIIKYCGREFYAKESFLLTLPEEYQENFHFQETQYTVDFVTIDPRGEIVVYDLVAHPLEDPVGLIKAELFEQQYPNVNFQVIDNRVYQKLKRHFEKKINYSSELSGWETSEDNLRNNPDKYS